MTEVRIEQSVERRSPSGLRLPRPARAVIFDMDGLLVDTEALFRDAMLAATADVGHEMPLELFLEMLGLSYGEGLAIMTRHFGETFPFEAWRAALVTRGRELRARGVALKAGVLELLELLEARGIPRAIATSSGRTKVAEQLAPSGLLPRFQAVIARGDYENGKPSPAPFLVAAARLGIAPEHCLALEDSHNGCAPLTRPA
jgi:HAD superfamily hydrolase (TIGR01509 family)